MADSYDELECIICLYKISDDQPYSMLNTKYEKAKYHIECLEQWINKSHNGILTQETITSYSIYHKNKLIETIKVITYDHTENDIDLTVPLLQSNKNNQLQSNQNNQLQINQNVKNNWCDYFCIIL